MNGLKTLKSLCGSLVFRILVGLLLLAILIYTVGEREILGSLFTVDLSYYLLGLFLYIAALGFLGSIRLHTVLVATGNKIKFMTVVNTNFMGMFFANFMPQVVGVDLTRVLELRRQGGAGTDVVASVFLDRVIGLISLFLMTFVGILVGFQLISDPSIIATIIVLAALFFCGWCFLFNLPFLQKFRFILDWPLIHPNREKVVQIYETLYQIRMQPGLIWRLIGICLVSQWVEVASVWALAYALDFSVAPFYFYIFVPIIWLITMLPVSIAGLGVREVAYVFFFSSVGMFQADAFSLSLLVYSTQLIMGIIGGLLFLSSSAKQPVQSRAIKASS
ncbi:MAG: lysylphosphatidylglycerol synthase transmembrane domain-containing protein [Chloroflexota bacterium]